MLRLYDSVQQFISKSGVPLSSGKVWVYLNGTDDLASVYADPNGLVPLQNPLEVDDDGRTLGAFVDQSKVYRLEVRDYTGALQWSVYPVSPLGGSGGGTGVVPVIVSSDGSVTVDQTVDGNRIIFDLSAHVEDSAESLAWYRGDGCTVSGDIYVPGKTAGTLEQGEGGVWLPENQYFHVTYHVRAQKTEAQPYYDKVDFLLQLMDGYTSEVTNVCRRSAVVDWSMGLSQDFEFSTDVMTESASELQLRILSQSVQGGNFTLLDVEIHRVYSGAPYIPGGGGGGGGDYTGGTGILVNNTTREISVDSSVVALKGELSQYVTDSELETILSGYATTSDLSQYATRAEVSYGLSGKQDVLTAGENITIVNNVISATGGGSTYTAGTGIDITGDVISVDTTTIATKTDLSGKQDVINDLSDIRAGAAAGATAVQPAALNDYATTSALNTALAGKQDTISDLSDIRSGAALGSTAVQPATLNDYATTSAMNTALAGKQDVLTAGSNVQISGSTISATDTTYTAGTGLSLTGTEFSVDSTTVAMKSDLPDLTPYVTDTELSTILQGYQTALTAGSNIQISNGVISATDTTYTAGTGLNLSNGEFSVDTSTIATQTDLSGKQDTLTAGTGISITNNTISCTASFTQQQANWAQTDTSAVDYIQNKPTIPTVPTPKELVPGTHISMVETSSNVTISATDVPTIGTVTV